MRRCAWQLNPMQTSNNVLHLTPNAPQPESVSFRETWGHCGGRLLSQGSHSTPEEQLALFRLFSRDAPFMASLSELYATDLNDFSSTILVIERLCVDARFLCDPVFRLAALNQVCAAALEVSGLVILFPAETRFEAGDEKARFLLPSRQNLALSLCIQLGVLGFAQLCTGPSTCGFRVGNSPIFMSPYDANLGLLPPSKLPTKQFSQALVVKRVCADSLILFDWRSLECRRV